MIALYASRFLFNVLFGHQRHSEATTRGLLNLESLTSLHRLLRDGVGLRIGFVVGVLRIGIDGALILTTLIQEVEFHDSRMSVLVALTF